MEYQIRTLVSTEYQTDTHDTRLILAEQLADVCDSASAGCWGVARGMVAGTDDLDIWRAATRQLAPAGCWKMARGKPAGADDQGRQLAPAGCTGRGLARKKHAGEDDLCTARDAT